MKKSHVLVFGVGGTGKSTIVTHLRARDMPVCDGDNVPGLAHFFDGGGQQVDFQRGADEQWLAEHPFRWNDSVLLQRIASQPTLYLFGLADTIFDLIDHFDIVFYLRADADLILQRLAHPKRNN